eukprot:5792261-Prymnesium_polylepis.1
MACGIARVGASWNGDRFGEDALDDVLLGQRVWNEPSLSSGSCEKCEDLAARLGDHQMGVQTEVPSPGCLRERTKHEL